MAGYELDGTDSSPDMIRFLFSPQLPDRFCRLTSLIFIGYWSLFIRGQAAGA
jgi:hypothetical protein